MALGQGCGQECQQGPSPAGGGEGDSPVTAGIGDAEGMLLPANLGWDKPQGDIQAWKGLGVTGSEWDSGWEMDFVGLLPGVGGEALRQQGCHPYWQVTGQSWLWTRRWAWGSRLKLSLPHSQSSSIWGIRGPGLLRMAAGGGAPWGCLLAPPQQHILPGGLSGPPWELWALKPPLPAGVQRLMTAVGGGLGGAPVSSGRTRTHEDIKAQGFMSRGGTKQNKLGVALGLALGFQDLQP